MLAFIGGLRRGSYMRHKLQCEYNARTLNLNDMIHYASNCAAADDDAGGVASNYADPAEEKQQ